jgi:hypothetical protein
MEQEGHTGICESVREGCALILLSTSGNPNDVVLDYVRHSCSLALFAAKSLQRVHLRFVFAECIIVTNCSSRSRLSVHASRDATAPLSVTPATLSGPEVNAVH